MTYGEKVGSLRRTLHRALVKHVSTRTNRPIAHLLALRSISRDEVNTQAQLAERLLIDAPATSRLLVKLEQEGLVKRSEGADRRCVCLKVTPAARKEIAVIDDGLRWLEGEVRRHLTAKEFELSKKVLTRLQQSIATR